MNSGRITTLLRPHACITTRRPHASTGGSSDNGDSSGSGIVLSTTTERTYIST